MNTENMNVDLTQAEDIVCERCGNYTFEQVVLMKKVSALISPTGRAGVAPIPVFACAACGNINTGFLPVVPKGMQEASDSGPRLVK
jgi:uncharacterized Zn finger protein